jgi:hypothetical protein
LPVYLWVLVSGIKKKNFVSEKFWLICAASMFIVFLLSPIREEMYPWYAIWFLTFTAFLYNIKKLQAFVFSLSFALMVRYLPYMALGTYSFPTPVIREFLTVALIVIIFPSSYVLIFKNE